MKGLLVVLTSCFFLISTVNIASAESWIFKKPSDYHTDSQLVSQGKSVNLIKFTTSEGAIKKDSAADEVNNPYMCLKLQWDTEEPIPYVQLGQHYEERENWQMLQFFLILQIDIP